MSHHRPDWDEYFLGLAREISTRSTCLRRQVGAILVRDHRPVSTGYNGAPAGVPHCATRGCLRDRLGIPSGERHELCWGAHADGNALVEAGRERARGGTLYIHGGTPCTYCAKLAINAGVVRIVCDAEYPDGLAREILHAAGVVVEVQPPVRANDNEYPGESKGNSV